MYKESLVIEYFEKLRKERIKYIEREIKLKPFAGKAFSIIGPRRAGKTYLMLNQFFNSSDSMYMDLESLEFSKIEPEEVLKIIALYEAKYGIKVNTILLDEIQTLREWNLLVRSLLNRQYKVFISGSSSKLLPKELGTSLRGRTLSYLLLPFSFREFLRAKKFRFEEPFSEVEIQKIKILLNEYLNYGGFPEIVFSDSKEKLLNEYFETIFYKDFVERHEVKSINTAKTVFEYLFQNFSKEINIEKIKNFIENQLKIKTKTTIYTYLDKISDTMVVFFVDRFSFSVYKRKHWPKKAYICDTGISSISEFSQNMGKKMENVVFLELLRKTNERPLLKFYYWKDYQGKEVDFVLKEGQRVKELIQVTCASGRDEIEKREIKSLVKASKELGCKNLLVITWDYEGEEKVKGKEIKFIPLWKWLLKG